jgi:hypothetical protein
MLILLRWEIFREGTRGERGLTTHGRRCYPLAGKEGAAWLDMAMGGYTVGRLPGVAPWWDCWENPRDSPPKNGLFCSSHSFKKPDNTVYVSSGASSGR